jgi:hypothetical protein
MFRQIAFFKPVVVAANLMCVPANGPTNVNLPLPAPIRAAVQQDARPAARPAVRLIAVPSDRDPAPESDGRKRNSGGLPSYTGGLTEEQMRAMD